jgi:hypothetical protein
MLIKWTVMVAAVAVAVLLVEWAIRRSDGGMGERTELGPGKMSANSAV